MSSAVRLIRILAVDDHPLIREGIAALIAGEADMRLVGACSNGREAIDQFRALRPDVTLMDLQMPEMSGIDAIIAIRAEFPEARIIVLTTHSGDMHVARAFKAGAAAFLVKNLVHRQLPETIRGVHAGVKALSAEASIDAAGQAAAAPLTPAEIATVDLDVPDDRSKD